jgi:hypothetical protein
MAGWAPGARRPAHDAPECSIEPTTDLTAIVSRAAAEMLWPGENPLGQVLRPAGAGDQFPWITVGGVVEDVILTDFRDAAPDPLV